jgi:hypothetical protein
MKQMKTYKNKPFYIVPLVGILAALLLGCNDMDDYKDYIKDGEISYTGRIVGVTMYPGYERIKIAGLLVSDPKIVKVKLFWNNNADSAEADVVRSEGIDVVTFLLEDLPENVYNFVLYTIDSEGNYSVPVNRTGTVYGERYRLSLTNRIVKSTIPSDSGLTVLWGETNYLEGLQYTEIVYTANDGLQDTLYQLPLGKDDSIRVDTLFLPDYKLESPVYYRSLFKPVDLSIDLFATDYRILKQREDITVQYMANTSSPFTYSSWDATRWGILENWVTTDPVKNHNGYGGYELYAGGKQLLTFDALSGAPAIENGKIYQAMTLPAGSYIFEVDVVTNSISGTKYMAINAGTELSNVDKVESEAIKYSDIASGVLEFDISEESEVSLGFCFDIPSGGVCRLSEVRLYKLE